MTRKMPSKRITIVDIIILVSVVVITALSVLLTIFGSSPSSAAVITTADESFEVSLQSDRTFEFSSNGYNYKAVVADGEISIVECDCPDGICRSSAPVGKNGGSIVCIPGKVIITCGEEVTSDEADVVVG
ncbi:MAG: NusG domain II-containing protein [Clostridia bacterium]|nr:NusG domain II-containing protein [Clostridia bacterium]